MNVEKKRMPASIPADSRRKEILMAAIRREQRRVIYGIVGIAFSSVASEGGLYYMYLQKVHPTIPMAISDILAGSVAVALSAAYSINASDRKKEIEKRSQDTFKRNKNL